MVRTTPAAVLVVHRDRVRLEELRELLGAGGYRVLAAQTAELALQLLNGLQVRCVVAALDLGDSGGLELAEEVHGRSPHTALILLGDEPDLERHPHVFGWLSDDSGAALLGMLRLAVDQARLDLSARLLEKIQVAG